MEILDEGGHVGGWAGRMIQGIQFISWAVRLSKPTSQIIERLELDLKQTHLLKQENMQSGIE
jgi:hypothetical protein